MADSLNLRDASLARWCHRLWNVHPHAKRQHVSPVTEPEDGHEAYQALGRRLVEQHPDIRALLDNSGVLAVLLYADLSSPEIEAWDLASSGLPVSSVARIMERPETTVSGLVRRAAFKLRTLPELERSAQAV